jgi:hypothetical protein
MPEGKTTFFVADQSKISTINSDEIAFMQHDIAATEANNKYAYMPIHAKGMLLGCAY